MLQSSDAGPAELTRLLDAWSAGERGALDRLAPLVEGDLRRLARSLMGRRAAAMTLQPTALVNEAYLRLAEGRQLSWENRLQFYAYAVTTMRRILVNYVRDRRAAKRGGLAAQVSLDQIRELPALGAPGPSADLLDLDRALSGLAELDPRQARIVELRYFGGLSVEETALALAISPRTVKREWFSARLYLLRALGHD
jgi:RNA polymerase sigma-70 factor (ECF subfamily)